MRYYVRFDEDGKLVGSMTYKGLNATMTEVSEAQYKKILKENGIELEPPAPIEYTETQLMGQQLTDLELLVLDHINAKEETV